MHLFGTCVGLVLEIIFETAVNWCCSGLLIVFCHECRTEKYCSKQRRAVALQCPNAFFALGILRLAMLDVSAIVRTCQDTRFWFVSWPSCQGLSQHRAATDFQRHVFRYSLLRRLVTATASRFRKTPLDVLTSTQALKVVEGLRLSRYRVASW